jgi:undecaprenyl pyrophosphate phosphatase UppP
MTTASPLTARPAPTGPAAPNRLDIPRVPFAHLLRVELRKTVDTGSGRWLAAGIVVATIVVVVAVLLTDDAPSLTFLNLARIAAIPPSLVLPVLAILTATTEWTQRTALVTYTLEPHRRRVTLAKLVAVATIGLLAVALGGQPRRGRLPGRVGRLGHLAQGHR